MIVKQLSPQLLSIPCKAVPGEPLHCGSNEIRKAFCCLSCLWCLLDCRRVYSIRLSIVVDLLPTQFLDALCSPVPAELSHCCNNNVCVRQCVVLSACAYVEPPPCLMDATAHDC